MHTDPTVPFAEGIIFYNDTISVCPGKPRKAKLRRDMYPWYYANKIRILGLEDHWL
jgi:hypothetical protein